MRSGSGKGLFVTGTDTGVGKTYIASGILRCLWSRGIDVGAMKPVETGCPSRAGTLVPQDSSLLLRESRANDALDIINPCRFRMPLAPMVAAEQEGSRVSFARILSAYKKLLARHEFLVVEGAGGIMVPLTNRLSYLDLASAMKLPVLVIARPDLGTINHTMLTVQALHLRKIPIAGIVLNHRSKMSPTAATRTNPEAIRRLTGTEVQVVHHGCTDLSPIVDNIPSLSR
jgi:dethiobiotin synthetase